MEKVRGYAIKAMVLAAIVVFAFWLASVAQDSSFFQNLVASYGYLGILLISFISGFNLFVPIPATSFLPLYAEAGLSIPASLVLITIGMTVADSLAYLAGRFGRDVAKGAEYNRFIAFFDRIKIKYKIAPLVIIFLYAAFAPLPNEVLVVPLALMRFPFIQLFPLLLAGNALFNTLTAYGFLNIFNAIAG